MPTNFLWAAGNNGYITPSPLVTSSNTNTSTTINSISPAVSVLKGTLVTGSGVPTPDFVTTTVSTSSSVTISTATTSTLVATAITFQQFPILIGGEATALGSGLTVTSSYWNGNGVFRQSNELLQALYSSIFFQAGGAFTPTAGGVISGWWLPSFDGGNTFETVVATGSTTVAALSRAPDWIIALDNAAYAAGNIRWASGRIVRPPPEADCKVVVQNNSGVAMPSTWMIGVGPATIQY